MAEGPQGLPLIKPPYRRLTAIDLKSGEHAFQIPVGDGPIDHPQSSTSTYLRWGADILLEALSRAEYSLLIGFLATLVELGDRVAHGGFLRVQDKSTGQLLGQLEIDRSLHGAPITYMYEGRQYIAVAGGGGSGKAELVVFSLPENNN